MDFSLFSILPEGTKTGLSLRTRRGYIPQKPAAATTYGLKLSGSSPACVIRTGKKYTKVTYLYIGNGQLLYCGTKNSRHSHYNSILKKKSA